MQMIQRVRIYRTHDHELMALYRAGVLDIAKEAKRAVIACYRGEEYHIELPAGKAAGGLPPKKELKILLDDKDAPGIVEWMYGFEEGYRNNMVKNLLRRAIGDNWMTYYRYDGWKPKNAGSGNPVPSSGKPGGQAFKPAPAKKPVLTSEDIFREIEEKKNKPAGSGRKVRNVKEWLDDHHSQADRADETGKADKTEDKAADQANTNANTNEKTEKSTETGNIPTGHKDTPEETEPLIRVVYDSGAREKIKDKAEKTGYEETRGEGQPTEKPVNPRQADEGTGLYHAPDMPEPAPASASAVDETENEPTTKEKTDRLHTMTTSEEGKAGSFRQEEAAGDAGGGQEESFDAFESWLSLSRS